MKNLVVYFSATGTTKNVSEKLASMLNADLYEIVPEVVYSAEDLDWTNNASRSSVEMNDKMSRPEIVKDNLDLSNYDSIYLGFPIWWYTAPRIINTFLESCDFSNKKVITFATSGGSSMGNTTNDLKSLYNDINFVDGLVVRGSSDLEKLVNM